LQSHPPLTPTFFYMVSFIWHGVFHLQLVQRRRPSMSLWHEHVSNMFAAVCFRVHTFVCMRRMPPSLVGGGNIDASGQDVLEYQVSANAPHRT
jgi:hypothetical protein